MIELPEAPLLGGQVAQQLRGLRITHVEAMAHPHKFAFFNGDPDTYGAMLLDRCVTDGRGAGGHVDIILGDMHLSLSDGVALRYHAYGDKLPQKHQLLLEFEDESHLSMSVRMYGFFLCFQEGHCDNGYHNAALSKPSPLTPAFDEAYFSRIVSQAISAKDRLSVKALLATEQRIPGLGNGVLQDILSNARINPKRRAAGLDDGEWESLFGSVKRTLSQMALQGGRDTERDIYDVKGGYATMLNSAAAGKPCPLCGDLIAKEAYLGGSVYYCPTCQPIPPSEKAPPRAKKE